MVSLLCFPSIHLDDISFLSIMHTKYRYIDVLCLILFCMFLIVLEDSLSLLFSASVFLCVCNFVCTFVCNFVCTFVCTCVCLISVRVSERMFYILPAQSGVKPISNKTKKPNTWLSVLTSTAHLYFLTFTQNGLESHVSTALY